MKDYEELQKVLGVAAYNKLMNDGAYEYEVDGTKYKITRGFTGRGVNITVSGVDSSGNSLSNLSVSSLPVIAPKKGLVYDSTGAYLQDDYNKTKLEVGKYYEYDGKEYRVDSIKDGKVEMTEVHFAPGAEKKPENETGLNETKTYSAIKVDDKAGTGKDDSSKSADSGAATTTGTDEGKKDLQAESIAAREAEEAKAAQLQKDKDNLSKVEAEIKAENEAAKKAVEDKLKIDDPAMKDGSEEEKKVLEANQNERTSKDDNYKEVTKSAVDNSHTTTKEGTGSIDRGKVGNQDVAKEDFVGLNGRTYKKGEHIANDYAQTVTDNYTITTSDGKTKTSSYLPYDMVLADPKNFANTELLKKIYLDNIENNYLGDAVNFEDGISELEFKAIFDSTGKYTAKDLTETAKAIREDLKYDPFTKQARVSFSKTKVSDEWKKIKAVTDGANKKKDELRKRVEDLQEKFKKIHGMLEGMKGEAIEKGCLNSLDTIMGRYDVNMAQINDRLEPAICAIDLLYGNPTEAKDVSVHFSHIPMPLPFTGMKDINDSMPLSERMDFVDKKINNMLGTGDTPEDPNIKKLDEDIKNIDGQISSAQSAINAARAAAKKAEEEKKNGTWVQKASATITTTVANVVDTAAAASRLASLQEQKKALEKKKEELADEIKKLEEEYEKADNIAQELMELIDNFDLNTRSFREALAPSPDNTTFNWIIADDKDRLRLLMEQKDNIITDFTDYNKYRQITNLSDYEPDDVLIYDSSHPLAYVVTEGFDPRKGTIKIACVDTKTGKRIGSDITVWDQREIAPIRGLRDMKDWHEYDDIPDKLPEPKPEKPNKPGGGGGGGGGNPSTTSPQTTSPQTTSPQTTSPQTTSPQTTSPQEIPPIPVYPVPGPGGDDYPGYNGPNAPHTGLDAIYGTGDTKQSAAGLGALAGLAAGAAGLGLTGLIGDKKDEDEDDEKESKAFKSEEVKPEEKKEPVVTDTTTNTEDTTSTTTPQFF